MATFNTTLQLDEPAENVDARIAAALSKLTSSRARSQPGLTVITREYRPTWAVILAIVGFFFFFLGLLFLLVKETQTLTISVSPRGEGGCTVVVAGEADGVVIAVFQSAFATPTRECPNCKRRMMREVGVCPHCGHESKPWTHHAGLWWCQSQSGDWQWLDEKAGIWRWYKDGTPTGPSATDRTPSLLVDPASVTPPDEPEAGLPSPAEPDPGGSSPVDGLEQLAALHARGALTDEEFQAAKARMLGL